MRLQPPFFIPLAPLHKKLLLCTYLTYYPNNPIIKKRQLIMSHQTDTLNDIKALTEASNYVQAMTRLNDYIDLHPDSADALFMRGKLFWRLGERARATADYAASAAIQPDGAAACALEHARDIEAFFNPDLLNP